MGNCPSADDGHGQSERMIGGTTTRRDSWAAAFQAGGCHQMMLDELLLGERKFLTNMQTLVDVFHAPLVRWLEQQEDTARAGTGCPVSRMDIAFVFSNLDELVVFSRRLLLALERVRVARSRAMLVVFLQLATSFKVFDAFMAGWNKRVECLNRMEAIPPVAMFFRACELQERCGGLHLRDLLAMPLQRVAQYRMLVESTVETCPPHLAVLHRELAQSLNIPFAVMHRTALDKSHKFGRCSGPAKTVNGPGYLPTSMATPRPKIREGRLTKICQDGPRSIRFVLYPDELFHASLEGVTGQAQQGLQNGRPRGVGSVPLGHCVVIDGFDAPLHSSFVVACGGSSFMVKATDVAEKNEWVAALKATKDGLLLGGSEPVSSVTASSSSASGEQLSSQAVSKKATSAADAVAQTATATATATAKATHGLGGGGPTSGGKRGSAKIETTSWSSSPSSPSSSGGGGRKADAGASGVVSVGEEATPPSPPRYARLAKGRGQGKRIGICKRAAWSRQGAVARLVYEKTTGRAPGGRDHSGGGRASDDTGNNENVSSNGVGGGASDPGVLPSDREGGSGDTSRGDSCEEETESISSPALEVCSFWAPCGSGDKATRWVTLRLDSPSTDEVWNGSVGFRRALANPACLAEFRELLRTCHAIENLNFREAVESYRALCFHEPSAAIDSDGWQHEGSDDARYAEARAAAAAAQDIVDRFVRDGGPEQVNLSAAGRETILSRQAKSLAGVVAGVPPPMEMFTEAWVEVSDLLQRGTFMRFRTSETFLQLEKTWAKELNGVLGASEFVLVTDGAPRASEGLAMLALRSSAPRMPPRLSGAVETGETLNKSRSSSSSSTLVAAAAATSSAPSSSSSSSCCSSTIAATSSTASSSSSSDSSCSSASSSSSASSTTSTASSSSRETRALGLARESLTATASTACPTPKSTGNASSANTGGTERQDAMVPDVFLQWKATVKRRARKTPPLISTQPRSAVAGDRERVPAQPSKIRDASDPGPVVANAKNARTLPIGGSSSGSSSGSGSGGTAFTRGRPTHSSPKVAKNCAMPPLPLAPSLRNISTDDAPASHSVPESSTKQALAAPVASNAIAGASPAATAAASATSAAATATASSAAAAAVASGPKRDRKAEPVASSAITETVPATGKAASTVATATAAAAAACQKCGKKKSSANSPPPASDALCGVTLEISTERLPSVAESPFVSPPHPPPRLILHRRPSPRAASRTTQTPPAAIFRMKSTTETPAPKTVAKADGVVHQPVRPRVTVTRTGAGKGQIVDDIEVVEGAASSKPKDQLVAAPLSGCGAELRGERRAVQGTNGGLGGRRDSKTMTMSAVRAAVARRARYSKVRLMLQAPPGTGLGVKLVNNKGMATVCAYQSPLNGNYDSALDAGLKVGDVLVSVNGLHVLGNFDQAVQLTMRGQESGVLSLVVRRPHEAPAGGLFEERRSVPPGRRIYRTLDYRL